MGMGITFECDQCYETFYTFNVAFVDAVTDAEKAGWIARSTPDDNGEYFALCKKCRYEHFELAGKIQHP